MTAGAIYHEWNRRAAQVADQVIQAQQHLHRHPELSDRASNPAALLADQLRTVHLDEVRTGIAAVLRGSLDGDRTIALRADIDALPVPDQCSVDFADNGPLDTGAGLPAHVPYDHPTGRLTPK